MAVATGGHLPTLVTVWIITHGFGDSRAGPVTHLSDALLRNSSVYPASHFSKCGLELDTPASLSAVSGPEALTINENHGQQIQIKAANK